MASEKRTSQQNHVEGYDNHMENHTTIYSEHEMEIDGVHLKERKETTTVTDINKVNLGKTVHHQFTRKHQFINVLQKK